jgi:hypothetical protein
MASPPGCRWSLRGKDAGSVNIGAYRRDRGRRLVVIQRFPWRHRADFAKHD